MATEYRFDREDGTDGSIYLVCSECEKDLLLLYDGHTLDEVVSTARRHECDVNGD